jgi:hypothetical protein
MGKNLPLDDNKMVLQIIKEVFLLVGKMTQSCHISIKKLLIRFFKQHK